MSVVLVVQYGIAMTDRAKPAGGFLSLLTETEVLLGIKYGAVAIAQLRGVTERSLRRSFARHGTTLGTVLLAARRDVVATLLQKNESLEVVAERVGFTTVRSERRWSSSFHALRR